MRARRCLPPRSRPPQPSRTDAISGVYNDEFLVASVDGVHVFLLVRGSVMAGVTEAGAAVSEIPPSDAAAYKRPPVERSARSSTSPGGGAATSYGSFSSSGSLGLHRAVVAVLVPLMLR